MQHAGPLVVIPTLIPLPLPPSRQSAIPAALDENRAVERQTQELHKLSHAYEFRVINPCMPRFKDHDTQRWLRGGAHGSLSKHCTHEAAECLHAHDSAYNRESAHDCMESYLSS